MRLQILESVSRLRGNYSRRLFLFFYARLLVEFLELYFSRVSFLCNAGSTDLCVLSLLVHSVTHSCEAVTTPAAAFGGNVTLIS